MWRAQTSRKGWHVLNAVRQLAAEAAPLRMPKPPPKSNILRLFKILGISLPVATSGLLGYAWYDQEFRQQLLDNVPYAKELLGNVIPESDEIPPAASIQKPAIFTSFEKAPVINLPDVPLEVSFQNTSNEKGIESLLKEKCQNIGAFVVEDLLNNDADSGSFVKKDIDETAGQQKSDKTDTSAGSRLQTRVPDVKADNAALETVIHKLLTTGPTLVAEATKAQAEAVARIRSHTRLLKQALDEAIDEHGNETRWEGVAIAHREKERAQLEANQRVSEAKKCVEALQDAIQEGKANQSTQNNPAIQEASQKLSDFLRDLGGINQQVRQAENEENAVQKYKDLVDKGRKLFQKELESLVPGAKPGSDNKFSEDDLNVLIAHAYRRLEQLRAQIAELKAQENKQLTAVLQEERKNEGKDTEKSIAEGCQRFREELEAEKSKLEVEYLMKLEAEVRKQLARQSAAHNEHLRNALTDQQEILDEEFDRSLQFRVLEERGKFQMEVAGWISRLKGIDAAIEARAETEQLTQSAQNLWLACIALTSVINFGGENGGPQPLRQSVETILKAGSSPFVEKMVNSFSSTALDQGVSTEEQLKRRFHKVSTVCRRLGLIKTENASLYSYIVSYLHSIVSLDSVVATSEVEEVDLNALDTFDLLAYARYWVDKGNLELALRFMIQLNGESRRAASDWINDALLYLETRQITRTLTAYASASGVANLF